MTPRDLKFGLDPANLIRFLKILRALLRLRRLLKTNRLGAVFHRIDSIPIVSLDAARIEATVMSVDFIVHRILRSRNPCLLRSLYLFQCFRTLPIDLHVAFGVRYDRSDLAGHAWLLRNDTYFLEPCDPEKDYHRMAIFPRQLSPMRPAGSNAKSA